MDSSDSSGSRHRTHPRAGHVRVSSLPKGRNGRALCRYCSIEVQPPRRTFCSHTCVHEWKLRSQPAYARRQVLKRDHRVCAACGVRDDDWEMDHIRPVVEGGGSCGLDNLRTLCRPCHAVATAQLARRRAARRKLGL